MIEIMKIVGAVGLVLICIGIIQKQRKRGDILYIVGGICLELYSISIRDLIFIILQLVFIASAVYDYLKRI